jgi:hypothetical protein
MLNPTTNVPLIIRVPYNLLVYIFSLHPVPQMAIIMNLFFAFRFVLFGVVVIVVWCEQGAKINGGKCEQSRADSFKKIRYNR